MRRSDTSRRHLSAQSDAIQILHESLTFSLGSNYNYPQQDLSTVWQTGYQPSEFAQSIFQHTLSSIPYTYQTPPPGIAHSSSSLANALQEQPPPPPRKVYEPETSTQFFNEFVVTKTKELPIATPSVPAPASKPPIPTPPATIPPVSPKHVFHAQTTTLAPKVTEPQAVTPRKRKHEDTETSIPKPQPSHQTPVNHPAFPRKNLSGLPRIPKKSQVYVDVPPRPSTWKGRTPLSQPPTNRESPLTAEGRSGDSHATAGSATQHRNHSGMSTTDSRTSPVKRTGERDGRGALFNSPI